MSFGDAVRSTLSKYCCFTGRARRSEFWYFTLFTIIISVALGSVLSLLGAQDTTVASVDSLVTLAMLLPRLGVIWRRFHDIGKSGANYFWILVPLVGLILFLVWMCREGDHGQNKYGPDPKEPAFARNDQAPWEY